MGANVEAPGLKLKVEALGFKPPALGAGACCCEGNNSSLSSQLIVTAPKPLPSNVVNCSWGE